MARTFAEIQAEWFGGEDLLHWDASDVERAFAAAENQLGRDWVDGSICLVADALLPGLGKRGGFNDFLRVYWLGKRLHAIDGIAGADALLKKVLAGNADAGSELTAIHLLRSRTGETELELEPLVAVGDTTKRPDFRIRYGAGPSVYVEVRKLGSSDASSRAQLFLQQVVGEIISIARPFILEIVFWRTPESPDEEDGVVAQAREACQQADDHQRDIADIATIFLKSGNPALASPTVLPEGAVPRMCVARTLFGPGEANRQVMVRIPFEDERAEAILRKKSKQLPKDGCGLVAVDVTAQPTAFVSWEQALLERFRSGDHTRVSGVLLFSFAISASARGMIWIPGVQLIANPRARMAMPSEVLDMVSAMREEKVRATGFPD